MALVAILRQQQQGLQLLIKHDQQTMLVDNAKFIIYESQT